MLMLSFLPRISKRLSESSRTDLAEIRFGLSRCPFGGLACRLFGGSCHFESRMLSGGEILSFGKADRQFEIKIFLTEFILYRMTRFLSAYGGSE